MSHAPPRPIAKPPSHGHEVHDAGHHAGHEHPAHLAHHWDTPKQQFEAGKLGMWLFLATEVLLFGGLFCAYAVWRGNHPELFKYGSQFLNTTLGATNTAVLILSSLTMAWAVTAAQQNKQLLLKVMLVLTLIGAATFMVIKYFEYTHKFHEGWYPGIKFYDVPGAQSHYFQRAGHAHGETTNDGNQHAPTAVSDGSHSTSSETAAVDQQQDQATKGEQTDLPPTDAPKYLPAPTGPTGLKDDVTLEAKPFEMEARHGSIHQHPLQDPARPANTHMFFNIYFMMTGLHGIHVLIGMIVIIWLLVKASLGHFSAEYFTPVDLGGLYWHIVDLIWIFLFPLFYLI
jgi:cytochrome c oxidase subunit III